MLGYGRLCVSFMCALLVVSCASSTRDYSGGTLQGRAVLMEHIERSTVYVRVGCKVLLPAPLRPEGMPDVMYKGGSGVILKSTHLGSYILTAKHVVASSLFFECDSFEVYQSGDVAHKFPMVAVVPWVVPDEPADTSPLKVGRYEVRDRETDIGVLFVKKDLGVNNRLADNVFLGEPVITAGFPAGLPPNLLPSLSITDGAVATKLFCKTKGLCIIRASAQVYSGCSGGPLFNYRGDIVGITSFIGALRVGPVYLVFGGGYYFVPYHVVRQELSAAKAKGKLPSLMD